MYPSGIMIPSRPDSGFQKTDFELMECGSSPQTGVPHVNVLVLGFFADFWHEL